jgi:hypothetical protein
VGTYSANIIAENIYEQVNVEDNTHIIFDEIVDHLKWTDAVSIEDGFVSHNNRRHPKSMTRGWSLLVQWKDGSTTWIPLKDLKESNPIQVADYAVANNLMSEPAFSWWVPYALKKRDRFVLAAKTRYQRTDQKFGIEIPKTVKFALEIERETGKKF